MPRERGESGQYRTTVTPDDVLDVLAAVQGPVVTSADVADALDVTRETARRKLESLTDDSRLDSRKTAGRVVVYWRAEEDAKSTDTG
jgi:predicted ArsR family transcriptional regulator